MAEAPRSFVMLGPPASGKGTQGRLLAERRELSYLSTGAQLRRELELESSIGERARPYLDRHEYVPDDLINEMVSAWIAEQNGAWVLDGFPRSSPQAAHLANATKQDVTVLQLVVGEKILTERVAKRRECPDCGHVATELSEICPKCGHELVVREDDTVEGFRSRLKAYQDFTLPALDELEKHYPILKIDGSGSREEVTARIVKALK